MGNHANRLARTGRSEQALAVDEEAVHLHRGLADGNRNAHLPDLAMSLSNHAVRLAGVGRREPALTASAEAARLRRELVGTDRDAYLPDLATSLLTEASVYLALGSSPDRGMTAAQECVELFGELANRYPDAFDGRLQAAIQTLIELCQAAGDHFTASHLRGRYGLPQSPGTPGRQRSLDAIVEDRSL